MGDERCPVCGMGTSNSKTTATHKGKEYKFCCYRCKRKFDGDPEEYLK